MWAPHRPSAVGVSPSRDPRGVSARDSIRFKIRRFGRMPAPIASVTTTLLCSSGPSLDPEEGMTEKQIHGRMERLQQLIAGFSKEYMHFRYAIGLHVHGGELSNYACEIGKVYE